MAPLQNSSNSSKNSSQTLQLQNSLELPTPWSCSANGGGVLEHLFCNSNSTQSCSIRQFQLNSKLAPPGVLEWSSSTQSWSHAKQGLSVTPPLLSTPPRVLPPAASLERTARRGPPFSPKNLRAPASVSLPPHTAAASPSPSRSPSVSSPSLPTLPIPVGGG